MHNDIAMYLKEHGLVLTTESLEILTKNQLEISQPPSA